jgi:non-ribosomal peptide synthetase component F
MGTVPGPEHPFPSTPTAAPPDPLATAWIECACGGDDVRDATREPAVSGAPLVDVLESGLMRMVEGRDVPGLLRRQAERYPEKPFLVWEPFAGPAETWTYKRMHEESTALAGGLAARGARAGDRILIHLANSPEFVIAWFACARLGAIAVSTNTRS